MSGRILTRSLKPWSPYVAALVPFVCAPCAQPDGTGGDKRDGGRGCGNPRQRPREERAQPRRAGEPDDDWIAVT